MDGLGILFIVGVVALILAAGIFAHFQEKKRREAMIAWARSVGLTWHGTGKDHSFDERFGEFGRLRQGSNRYAYNICSGDRGGRPVLLFDYHYETYSTDSKGRRQTNHHYFSAVIIETNLPLQRLSIRPENFFDKVTEFFGADDIDFESAEFSRRFYVKSPSKRWAYDVIHQEAMEFLLARPVHTIEVEGPRLLVTGSGRFSPQEYAAALEVGEGLIDRLPESVLRELRERV